ncbi:MAG: 50S ribosomal protein L24e [Thermoplasmata archaeon]|nr:50S ribosomal protein L24e [Thermoplasmata archaeon]
MVEQKLCSFCGNNIEPGTGRLFIRKDGSTFIFCSNKCFKNLMDLKRVPRATQWTAAYKRDKGVRLAAETQHGKSDSKKPAKKVKRNVRGKAEKKEKPEEKEKSVPQEAEKDKGDEN